MRPFIIPLDKLICGFFRVHISETFNIAVTVPDDHFPAGVGGKELFLLLDGVSPFSRLALDFIAEDKGKPGFLDGDADADKGGHVDDLAGLRLHVIQIAEERFHGVHPNKLQVDLVAAGGVETEAMISQCDLNLGIHGAEILDGDNSGVDEFTVFHGKFSLYSGLRRGRIGIGGEIRACRFILGRQAGREAVTLALFLILIIHYLEYKVNK